MKVKPTIKFEDFQNLDLKVGKVISVKDHPNADKLYILLVNIGSSEKIQLVAGIKQHYKKQELLNKKIIIVRNLEHKVIRGIDSEGMLLAAVSKDKITLLTPEQDVPEGSRIQ